MVDASQKTQESEVCESKVAGDETGFWINFSALMLLFG